MSNKELQNNAEDEILSVGDVKIQQMIKNLQRVDAPKDFDFRLKARIANAKSTDFQPRFFPVLRYVLPLSVVVLIFVIVNGIYFGGNNQTVAEIQPIPAESKVPPANNSPIAPPETAKLPVESAQDENVADLSQPKVQTKKKETIFIDDSRLTAAKLPKKPQNKLPKEVMIDEDENEGKGSIDTSYTKTPVITPRGIPSNDLVETLLNNENKNDILTKQILLPLGIEIVSENGNRFVKSVAKNSRAERANVKVGDLIEAIDGEKVSGDAVRGKKLEGRQITVMRGAEKVEITFDNQ